MIKIERHARGIQISGESSLLKNPYINRLEQKIGADYLFLYRGHLVLPLNVAVDLLEVIGPHGAIWDPEILTLANHQTEHRRAQLIARMEVASALDNPEVALAGSELRAKLDRHQLEAVAAAVASSLKGIAIFDEQGTGKTLMALAAFDWLAQQQTVKRLIVVAPKSVLASWSADANKFLEGRYIVSLVHGSAVKRRQALLNPHDILLIGYESVVSELRLLKMILAAKTNAYMLVVDESYFVKNPDAARSQAVTELRPLAERAIILCGTPAPNSATDIVNQINIADGGVAFRNVTIPDDEHEAERVIRETLGDVIYLRRLKEDVLPDIPGKEFVRTYLDLQPNQREMYDTARNELVLRARSVDDREFVRNLNSFLAQRVRLLQVCSNPLSLDPLYAETPAKLLALDRLLAELIDKQGKKVVLWSFFRPSLQAIVDRFQKYGVARIDGSVPKVEDRIQAIERFQTDSAVRLFVGNAAAAGAGITLTAAHHAIYESFSSQAAHYMQSMDRIHRRGQTEDVTYHVLLARDTIEEREFDRLVGKERAGRDLLGDLYEAPMTRERFLAELGESNEK